jgi:hypothetical protein
VYRSCDAKQKSSDGDNPGGKMCKRGYAGVWSQMVVYIGEFGSNLASVAQKMFSNSI